MSYEIKFRAWDKERREMTYVSDLYWFEEEGVHDSNGCGHYANYEIMPFTNIYDKNGKEIYLGDVVEYNTFDDFDCYSIVKIGEYVQDGSGGEYSGRKCFGIYVEVDNFTCPDWCDNEPECFNDYLNTQNLLEVSKECVVIGNIHENPELLSTVETIGYADQSCLASAT